MTVYSMVITGYHSSNPLCGYQIINNFSNTIIIGKFVHVISKQKHIHLNLAILGYIVRTAHLKNSLVQLN